MHTCGRYSEELERVAAETAVPAVHCPLFAFLRRRAFYVSRRVLLQVRLPLSRAEADATGAESEAEQLEVAHNCSDEELRRLPPPGRRYTLHGWQPFPSSLSQAAFTLSE
jgi:hypothetical protein